LIGGVCIAYSKSLDYTKARMLFIIESVVMDSEIMERIVNAAKEEGKSLETCCRGRNTYLLALKTEWTK
jgi:hypothetical protein